VASCRQTALSTKSRRPPKARFGFLVFATLLAAPLHASDYLFLSRRYVQLTQDVMKEANAQADKIMKAGSPLRERYDAATSELQKTFDELGRAKVFKKLKPGMTAEVKDEAFAKNLNVFKDALRWMAEQAGQPPEALFPSYTTWINTETAVVQQGLTKRLDAFETRFGPDSEQINFIELLLGEAFFRGDEAAPSPWEPIVRLSAVQLTTAGPGLVSSFQTGMNYYFVKRSPPAPLKWIGVTNHVGLAATLQYLNDPRLLRFEGRPAFGFVLHMDRKEVGANWDPDQETVRLTLGYAFQFVPLML
jgi:hypothetical protein